ncbi:hypothetical protein [Vibrio nigripulchritudo]|uniref:hypothetical protein n=1 Tax=Vibrio nigripulchritudo TaxID=28173 RepID=UPI001CED5F5D|nr:hypothetical protein [Vibrio nigripulchritudo]
MKKIQFAVTAISISLCFPAFGKWLSTHGTVTSITTYGHTNTILVDLSDQGANIAKCTSKTTFAISSNLDPEALSNVFDVADGKSVWQTCDGFI